MNKETTTDQYHNCQEVLDARYFQNGEYLIYIAGVLNPTPVPVYCDQQKDQGGWLVSDILYFILVLTNCLKPI